MDIKYIAADYGAYEDDHREEYYDIAYMEGGVLHYFGNIVKMFRNTHRMLRKGGRLVLDDFHPFRKLASDFATGGEYFDTGLHDGTVPYAGIPKGAVPSTMPQCLLGYWTTREVVTAVASAGFHIEEKTERSRQDAPKLPSDYEILANRA